VERLHSLVVTTFTPESIKEIERPSFDLKLVPKVAPDCEWNNMITSFYWIQGKSSSILLMI
jgi:hypothetical protein